jgi:glycosyltransferase involved in cell wall biosynthesis
MRNPKRCIYTSSYDRGLVHLLELWPEVKKAVPDATLDIYYGWELFDKFYSNNPSSMKWKEHMLEMMKYDGVSEHGRIPQKQVEEEMKKTSIWPYPTHFGEINCITGLKAQAFGAIPVVINYAALETTVQFGIKVNGDIYDKEVQDVFRDQLIWVLQHPEWQEEVRKPMMAWASKKFLWSEIAKHWNAEFEGKAYDFWELPKDVVIKIVEGYRKDVKNG